MILLVDNYDSFVYNLARYVAELGFESVVKRNDEITIGEIYELNPSHIILSPGPRAPVDAGITLDVVNNFAGAIPILGVCLGHQAIAQAMGGVVVKAIEPMHGKSRPVEHDGTGVFFNLSNPLTVARYHSLIVEKDSFPHDKLKITAKSQLGEIMGISNDEMKLYGVQFHPESVLTENGQDIIRNFIRC